MKASAGQTITVEFSESDIDGDAGVLHGTVISRCAEHASLKPVTVQRATTRLASTLLNISWLTKRVSRILLVKGLIHSLNAGGPAMSVPALVITKSSVQRRSMVFAIMFMERLGFVA